MKTLELTNSQGVRWSWISAWCDGGSVAEWLRRRTWNLVIPSSRPALPTIWICSRFWFNSSGALVQSQLVCFLQLGLIYLFMFHLFTCFLQTAPASSILSKNRSPKERHFSNSTIFMFWIVSLLSAKPWKNSHLKIEGNHDLWRVRGLQWEASQIPLDHAGHIGTSEDTSLSLQRDSLTVRVFSL